MKKITINKMARVEAPVEDEAVAYQVVKFLIDFFGNIVETTHDTAIYADGRQEVIGGCGFIPHGFRVDQLAA